jgi:tRNA threonylcarbamoyladenosine biosynthesis protein TsaB
MNFLSIDCSMDIGSLFIKVENKTFSKLLQSDKSNNDLLMKQILDFFLENNIKINNLTHIFVNQGPGNFSGLRGSLSTAKGISLSKNLRLFGYNTFIWSCAKFFDKQKTIFSLLEFRKKFFIKKFDNLVEDNSKVEEIEIKDLISGFNDKFMVIPKEMVKKFDKKILELNNLNIVELDHIDLESLKLKGLLDEDLIKPLYLT